MKILSGGSLQLVYALLILLHMQTSIGFNSTIDDDEVRCIESERQALLAFKRGLVDEADRLSSWGSEEEKKECCKWEGVQCSNTTKHVTLLNLTSGDAFMLRDSYLNDNSFYPGFYVDKASAMWKGMERYYEKGNLKTLKIIDLSSNKLTGKIPTQISVLLELVELNLSRNQLTGWIPSNIGQMRQLESLDLSWNQLSGQLPWSMSQLNFLSTLNLSYNNFSGRIPLATQLQTFNASSFVGNRALCGLPLTPTCREDEKTESKPKNRDIAEFWKSYKQAMELGAAVGFAGVLTVRLDHPWKHLCLLLYNNVSVCLSDLKDCLYFLVAAVGLVVRQHVSRLRRKLKLFKPSVSS